MVGVLPRPKESAHYERQRLLANARLGEALHDLRARQTGDVSYMDPDPFMNVGLFARDGVHLNRDGMNVFGNKLRNWVTGKIHFMNFAKNQERMNE